MSLGRTTRKAAIRASLYPLCLDDVLTALLFIYSFLVIVVLNKRHLIPVEKRTLDPMYITQDAAFDFLRSQTCSASSSLLCGICAQEGLSQRSYRAIGCKFGLDSTVRATLYVSYLSSVIFAVQVYIRAAHLTSTPARTPTPAISPSSLYSLL